MFVPFRIVRNVTPKTRISDLNLEGTKQLQVPENLVPRELMDVPIRDAFYLDKPVSYLTSGANIGNASPDATLGQLGEREGFYKVDSKKLGR